MLKPRVIPFLLIQNGALVKTKKFSEPKYVGDPLNAVRIFNEKEVDEIMVADMDATIQGREPDMEMIAKLATECRMPLCYTGGVKNPEQVEKIVSLGVEKVGISSAAVDNPEIVSESARRVGSQSVVVVLDVRKTGPDYEIFTRNAKKRSGLSPATFARKMQELGAGEIVLNSIERDGTGEGYDVAVAREVRNSVSLPLTLLGGAGKLDDFVKIIQEFKTIGLAAGSFFVFQGKYRAVLITYPSAKDKESLFE